MVILGTHDAQLVLLITVYTGQNMKPISRLRFKLCCTTGSATEYTAVILNRSTVRRASPEQSSMNIVELTHQMTCVNIARLHPPPFRSFCSVLHPSHRMCDYAVYCISLAPGRDILTIFHLLRWLWFGVMVTMAILLIAEDAGSAGGVVNTCVVFVCISCADVRSLIVLRNWDRL